MSAVFEMGIRIKPEALSLAEFESAHSYRNQFQENWRSQF
jgi:hypothetical protein